MTTQIKHYPFEVAISGATPRAVLADQVKSLDWRVRKAVRKGRASAGELTEVRRKAACTHWLMFVGSHIDGAEKGRVKRAIRYVRDSILGRTDFHRAG
jgi:hypothetical protein